MVKKTPKPKTPPKPKRKPKPKPKNGNTIQGKGRRLSGAQLKRNNRNRRG